MFLGHSTEISRGIEMPEAFDIFPKKLEPAILESLISKVRAGDEHAITEVIAGHARLAVAIAAQYASYLPHKDLDLASAALEGLAQAVHWIKEGRCPHNNPVAYIVVTIHRFVTEFIEYDSQIRIPRKSLKTAGIDIAEFLATCLDHTKDVASPQTREQHIRECVALAVRTPTELVILESFERGDSADEIAAALGYNRSRIFQIRKELYMRFLHYYNE